MFLCFYLQINVFNIYVTNMQINNIGSLLSQNLNKRVHRA